MKVKLVIIALFIFSFSVCENNCIEGDNYYNVEYTGEEIAGLGWNLWETIDERLYILSGDTTPDVTSDLWQPAHLYSTFSHKVYYYDFKESTFYFYTAYKDTDNFYYEDYFSYVIDGDILKHYINMEFPVVKSYLFKLEDDYLYLLQEPYKADFCNDWFSEKGSYKRLESFSAKIKKGSPVKVY